MTQALISDLARELATKSFTTWAEAGKSIQMVSVYITTLTATTGYNLMTADGLRLICSEFNHNLQY